MKIWIKIIIIVLIILSGLGYFGYKFINGPSVSMKDKKEVKKYVENYLIKKYGNHNYKITGIRYEYHMTTLFDYSDPTGYWVDFKSDVVSNSWITIDGLKPNDYKVKNDYFIESYYFNDKDGYDVYETLNNMKPKKELEKIHLNEVQKEFDSNVNEVVCNTIILEIPDDYGKIPTLDELKTNTNLYRVTQFTIKKSNTIDDEKKYEEKLKLYIKNKYNCNSDIFFNANNSISVFLEDK